jgi:UDPglucose 6-dehydrogenase
VFDPYEALSGAHAAVVVTEWEEIRSLDLKEAAALMEPPKLLVDGRNALDTALARDTGLIYRDFGRE